MKPMNNRRRATLSQLGKAGYNCSAKFHVVAIESSVDLDFVSEKPLRVDSGFQGTRQLHTGTFIKEYLTVKMTLVRPVAV